MGWFKPKLPNYDAKIEAEDLSLPLGAQAEITFEQFERCTPTFEHDLCLDTQGAQAKTTAGSVKDN